MKKFSILFLSALVLAAPAFAETAGVPMLMGKIKSVVPGAAGIGHTKLILVDGTGKETKVKLSKRTAITDKSGKPAPLSGLEAGKNVQVKIAGENASSIQIED